MTCAVGLLFGNFALAAFGAGQVWLVQLSSYRLFTHVGAREFYAYHLVWWRSIWFVVLGPAGLVFFGAVLMMWWRPPAVQGWMLWCALGLQILLYALTAAWFGPLMARLATPDAGLLPARYHLLMTTHWARVAIITAYALLTGWMVARSLAPQP